MPTQRDDPPQPLSPSRELLCRASSWGYHQAVVGFALGEYLPLVFVFLEEKVRGSAGDTVNRRQFLRDKVGDLAHRAPGHHAPQVLRAGDQIDGVDFGIAIDTLSDIV